MYTHQAKATQRFGIEFRSKLEAQWAYRFERNRHEWEYADANFYDFTVDGFFVEIKPKLRRMLDLSVNRMTESNPLLILLGNPSDYWAKWCTPDMGGIWIYQLPQIFDEEWAESQRRNGRGSLLVEFIPPRSLNPLQAFWLDGVLWIDPAKEDDLLHAGNTEEGCPTHNDINIELAQKDEQHFRKYILGL